ncbi:Glycosyl transferase family protein [Candidatus Terasakiella magnetica]|uniref:Glycosyl transferase family protein n=1 Tax=Candidatus Terasakiella magnetica TaxID=1867952 RepID=A0A1C3REV8_9PROT|nr:glycosyltransferase family 9 protein [Candidatus Terasakiella magnetica]SCA55823.1 Glycosyl transferase family protein [Candidatus Terasakiella magnetica]
MRILFITSTRIGDAVLSTGLLNNLIERHPEAKFTIACGPVAAPLFEATPQVERILVMTKKKRSMHWVDLWKECGFTWWYRVIDLRNGPITYLFPTLRGTHLLRDDKSKHRVELFSDLLDLDIAQGPVLWTNEAHEEQADTLLPKGEKILAVGPTANWRGKTWRAENFLELCQRLTAPDGPLAGVKIALFGHVSEREQAQGLINGLEESQKIDLIGEHSLPVVYACLKRCSFYVGNDSGLMHMSVAANIPTLGLFGPTQEKLYSPWGEHCATVRTKVPFLELFGENFDHKKTDSLMDSLSVDMAYEAALNLWKKQS